MIKNLYQIKKSELGKRLDLVLKKQITNYSRNYIVSLIRKGNIKINNITVLNPSIKLRNLGEIEIIQDKKDEKKIKNIHPLTTVFEDEDLIVINKQAGVLTHSSEGNETVSLVDIMLSKGIKLYKNVEKIRPGVVHRLDKDTSGLIVFAKTELASQCLFKQFANRKVKKIYEAIVWGQLQPLAGAINIPITNYKNKKKPAYDKNAKSAYTKYKTLKTDNCFFSLVECRMFTGRTHQIRIHMLSKNCPLIGDQLYSRGRNLPKTINENKAQLIKKFNRQALHSKQLDFIHPKSKKCFSFKVEKPIDMKELEDCLFNKE